MQRVVAIDIGGTKIAAAAVGADGRVGEVEFAATPAQRGAAEILDAAADLVARVAGGPLAAVGVGAAGTIDAARGAVIASTDALKGWAGTELRAELAERLGVSASCVAVQNDVHAHAEGEARCGAGAQHASALVVAVGTGVGGALVDGGRVRRGAHSTAGAIGHIPVPGAAGMPCTCGTTGHLEAIAAGPSVLREFRAAGGRAADARAVFALADGGDATARSVVARAATALGRALAGMVALVDPDVVILGGGVAESGQFWWSGVDRAMRADLVGVAPHIRLEPAMLGTRAALVGAGLAAYDLVGAGA